MLFMCIFVTMPIHKIMRVNLLNGCATPSSPIINITIVSPKTIRSSIDRTLASHHTGNKQTLHVNGILNVMPNVCTSCTAMNRAITIRWQRNSVCSIYLSLWLAEHFNNTITIIISSSSISRPHVMPFTEFVYYYIPPPNIIPKTIVMLSRCVWLWTPGENRYISYSVVK